MQELYSFDEPSLYRYLPLYGVIFLFKYGKISHGGPPLDGIYRSQLPEEEQGDIFFARQMISNACATQAVLNIVMNRDGIDLGKELQEFKEFTSTFDSELKGETLTNSDLIRSVHNSFTSPNMFDDESRPKRSPNDDDIYHFVAFIQKDGRIWELDGLRPEPIALEKCTDAQFVERLPHVLQRRISKYPENELHFSLMAVMEDRRAVFSASGDRESLEDAFAIRKQWKFENALRRMEMSGLVHEATRLIAKHTTEEEWQKKAQLAAEKGNIRANKSRGEEYGGWF